MPWQRTRRQTFATDAGRLWSVVGDPRRWAQWCGAIEEARVDGDVRAGATGAYAPAGPFSALHRRTAPPLRLVEVTPPATAAPGRLTLEQPLPGGAMRVEWVVEAGVDGMSCALSQRISLTGPASPLVARLVAGPLSDGWPDDLARLASLVVTPRPDGLEVVVAGGSGSLGRALAADLAARGHGVVLLTRRADAGVPHRQVEWDGVHDGAWEQVLSDPARTAVVNLAGRLVDARPTAANVDALRESRVLPTRALVRASGRLPVPVARWVQGSTTAIWSDAGETRVTETTPLPTGPAALPQMTGVARPWEAESEGAAAAHRVVLRTSIVLQPGSPALRRLETLTRLGLGGRVGSGRQWFSWVHVDDWLAVVRAALGLTPDVVLPDGPLIASSPSPVRNVDLMRSLRRRLGRPPAPPTPERAVAVGSVVLRTDPALGLTGRHCTSSVLAAAGFRFEHPDLDEALDDLLH
ncbi:DUF1731 domain-containing protein [Terracoccus luteus]|uniref:DUF1731 domain-containing protein n=1 Tax=Terracoccus luteus TaxID=53356 RepID=A0A839PTX8_9MICO|nr:DUF1731 domain-containing protein [Terracoccus luteus]MBB2986967.1 hypothetical protein [Terracoccus luteus]MCP2172618.1 hypothetical protein [Terracoccus luteus]